MKITLKHKYTGGIKTFDNKTEMIDYIKNYLDYAIGLPVNKKDNIYILKDKYFSDYDIIK